MTFGLIEKKNFFSPKFHGRYLKIFEKEVFFRSILAPKKKFMTIYLSFEYTTELSKYGFGIAIGF